MNKNKKKLIILLVIQVVLTILHRSNIVSFSGSDWTHFANWTYWLGMCFGIYVLFFTFNLHCSQCGARQVFRSFNSLDFRWPQNNCHKCGCKVE